MQQLIDDFDLLDDWEERYRYLIDLGKKLQPLAESERTEGNRVRGCMNQAWLTCHIGQGPNPVFEIRGDAERNAWITKGLIYVLILMLSGKTAQQILATDIEGIFSRLGFENQIMMNRRNGFYSMVERIRGLAQQAR